VALVPLVLVARVRGSGSAFLAGWIAGAVAHGAIFHWISHTARTMSDFPGWAAWGVLGIFALGEGIGYGLLALGTRAIRLGRQRLGIAQALSIAALAVAIEHLWPQLFPWHLGGAVFRVPILLQGMDVTGVGGATFVAAMIAIVVAAGIEGMLDRRGPSWGLVLASTVILAAWIGYGGLRLGQVREAQTSGRSVRLALVQPDITSMEKKSRDRAFRRTFLDRLWEVTNRADLEGVDAIIWPEGAFPFSFGLDEESLPHWMTAASRDLVAGVARSNRPLLMGSVTRPAGSRPRNTAILFAPDGSESARYDKRRLLAFGEYMPFSDWIPGLKGRVRQVADLEPGTESMAFEIGGARALPSICYEAIFPAFTRRAFLDTDADFIVNLTNDGWFGDHGAPAQHLMVQVPRAVELRTALVRVTQTGITAVVQPSGDFILETGIHERRVDVVSVPVDTGLGSPFRSLGEVFAWACVAGAALAVASAVWRYRRGKKSRSTTTG
jgi:apolipoprotein N-acyltransferase